MITMIVTLLNDGFYEDLDGVDFPVKVEAEIIGRDVAFITGEELIRIGGYNFETSYPYCFVLGEECVIGEAP